MNAFLFGCCWKISRASCGIPIVICFAMVLGRPAPFLAPPLVFLLGVSWMLFILFVFLQSSLKSMGWGFRPFPIALRAFRPFCAFVIWTWKRDLVQLRSRECRLNTFLLLLRVQLATTYALGWVAVILKGCTPFRLQYKDTNFFWNQQVFFLFFRRMFVFFLPKSPHAFLNEWGKT